ncbi:hypothetical protein CWO17_12610 [Vibrio sp. 10N.286.45.A3]|nr:hypothetical protein BCU34_05445 [Vibrio sp. 10N.286.45.E10]PTP03805.1 hypothetical protein CWO17_12610 [Vibrio sp. 10N.286.45.A3]PTQ23875.1 hypothetical protein CWO24_11450 [Vibrio sp. 10N.286.46.E10]TKE76646.1 hypothetical protein FCV56_19985 [Vibrio sp. F12]TKE95576.1 hypothetical protein FCV61_18610 [Vibrio sp. F12]
MWCNFLQDGAKIKFLSWLISILIIFDRLAFVKLLFLLVNISCLLIAMKWRVICLVWIITIMDN